MIRPVLQRPTIFIAGLLSVAAVAAIAEVPSPAHWTARPPAARALRADAKFTLQLNATIDPGWHIYALEEPEGGPIATEVGLAADDPFTLLRVDEAPPRMVPDPFYKQPLGQFQDHAAFTLTLKMPHYALAKATVLHILVRFQSCNDKVCLPPRTVTVPVPVASNLR